jgi:perosamine synthetase
LISLSGPDITQAERDAVLEVLNSRVLSIGPRVVEFERLVAATAGVKHGIAVNSGTSALFLVLQALGIGPGDEVITTPFTFVATINVIIMTGATPVFVDIDPGSYNIDLAQVRAAITPATKAIMPVDVFGLPAPLVELEALCREHGLELIDDSCEALGATLGDRPVGSFGAAGAFAFYPNKQITTGEGGIVVTNRDDVAAICRSLRNQGRDDGSDWLEHDRLGYNYRMSELNAALGAVQMTRLPEILAKRSAVAAAYQEELTGEARLTLPQEVVGAARRSWFVYVVQLAETYTREQRNALIAALRGRGIQCSNYFAPVHVMPFLEKRFNRTWSFPVTEHVSDRTLALPFHSTLPREDVKQVCDTLKELL